MYARIIGNVVTEVTEGVPALAPGECAHIEEVFDWDVRPGWTWTPEGFSAPPEPDPNADIDARIAALEATVTQRRLREAVLTSEGAAWLADLEAQIAGLRALRLPGEGA